jgi:2-aminoadipate transaminase
MDNIFADRMADVPKSFIREILKTTENERLISFAGGLPNRELFPIGEIKAATSKTLDAFGAEVLQYSTTEGYLPLREWISQRYKSQYGLDVPAQRILITNGSQQGLDLIGKVLLNEQDHVAIEEPGYLGAIQAFSLYRSLFEPVPLHFEGLNTDCLAEKLKQVTIKLIYTVPNFQNPSGISHSDANRDEVANLLSKYNTFMVEDDPYAELRFSGERKKSYYARMPEKTILLGSFSKIFVPSFRIGWIVVPEMLYEKVVIAKQAADLHTNYFAQRVLYQYILDNNIDTHIQKIREKYHAQKAAMIEAIKKYFPAQIQFSNPDGGMFLWAILPSGIRARDVFEKSAKENVVFVPGDPFYTKSVNVNTMRLNFSCVDEEAIDIGVRKLGLILHSYL